MNVLALNVYWPTKDSNQVAFGGRILLPFERNEYLAFNPENFEVEATRWPNPHR